MVTIQQSAENLIIQLTDEQLLEIALSKKDIEEGLLIENTILVKEVKQWLKRR